ncbi:hypothetical protein BH09BAC1_BH09BAC1_18710 [soil metagenome]
MIYKIVIIFSFTLLLMATVANGQIVTDDKPTPAARPSREPEDKIWKWDRFYVGGFPIFGISANSYGGLAISTGLSAEAGYFVHNRLALGLRTSYIYSSFDYGNNSFEKTHLIVGSPYVRGYIWKGLFGQVEYQFANVLATINVPAFNADFTWRNNSLLLGGGYHGNFDYGFGYYFSLMFNLYNTGTNFIQSPDLRIGFTYRFHGQK